MSETAKNLPASILHRLRNKARAEGRNAQDLLRYYAIERFLYRLSQSSHTDHFVLKGALIFLAWGLDFPRPTRDIDLAGFVAGDVETMRSIMQDVCRTPVVADGMEYDATSVASEIVREGARYQGVRIRLSSALGKAHALMQIDVGVADVITPPAQRVIYPTLLSMPAPELRGYPPETVIAEKLEAMVVLDEINSRMKDFYDIWLIARSFELEADLLRQAIHATFHQRRTNLPAGMPMALTDSFAAQKQGLWHAFITRSELGADAPLNFQTVVEELRTFVTPLFTGLR